MVGHRLITAVFPLALAAYCSFYLFFSLEAPLQIYDIFRPVKFMGSGKVYNISAIKSNKWIVVTSVQSPTEDVKRLAAFADWNLVVVADKKTPQDWSLPGVHFLSVDIQTSLPFGLADNLPYKSYTRKNIGYLYAIALGAEWIYDTDDDNKPFGNGLDQFDYTVNTSGVRFMKNEQPKEYSARLFNPYRFFGVPDMWPRGFPLHLIHGHTNGKNLTLCRTMPTAAVQQGLVYHDPDVDAIYRLLQADRATGLNERFNKFAPPVTLAAGTFSPWNSQNTLFHRNAFHTLFLPTTVSFRTTDIWRSYFAQGILHLAGDTVSFVPTNAVQVRNAHNYLHDFEEEKQVFEQSGKIVEFLDTWRCGAPNMAACILELASAFKDNEFWLEDDEKLVGSWVADLVKLGFQFPNITLKKDIFVPWTNEADPSRQNNCRRMDLSVLIDTPQNSSEPAFERAVQKLNAFGDLGEWCRQANKSVTFPKPSPKQLAETHAKNDVLSNHLDQVLVITNNYAWKNSIGVLQRMYEPYFGVVIFCGTWDPAKYSDDEGTPKMKQPFNYIHMKDIEMYKGFFGYYCASLVSEMKLHDVQGYIVMSDDTVFNIWQRIDVKRVSHLMGVAYYNQRGPHWGSPWGIVAAEKIIKAVSESKDPAVLATWAEFEQGLVENGYIGKNMTKKTAIDEMRDATSWSPSDFYYIPANRMDYTGRMMRLFYDGGLYHELAFNKFMRSVPHQTSRESINSYLWGGNRPIWDKHYNAERVAMHPIKFSFLTNTSELNKFCNTVIRTFAGVLLDNTTTYTVKKDTDIDWRNG